MKKNNILKTTIQIFIIFIIGYILGFILSNYKLLDNRDFIGKTKLENNIIDTNNITIKKGKYITKGSDSSITFKIEEKYINKIIFNYNTKSNFEWSLTYKQKDEYGNDQEVTKSGISSNKINIFSEKLDNRIKEITFTTNVSNIEIDDIFIQNKINYFSDITITILIASLAVFILFKYRKYLSKHIEYMFLIITISVGVSMIFSMPVAIGTSWDDETHFLNAYGLLNEYHTEATLELHQVTETNYGMFNTQEEQDQYIEHLNNIDNNLTDIKTNIRWSYNKVSYIPQSLIMKLAKLVNINISEIFILGKITNLITYSIVILFAIKKIPKFKYLMVTIALLPTPIFLASNYSYDPTVTSFTMLGLAYFYYEYNNKTKIINSKNIIISMLSFIIASCSKAIYIPLILIVLLLPNSKFVNKNQRKKFFMAIIGIFVMMMSTFILPTFSGTAVADPRGGDTNVSEQLKLVLKQPISFIKVFWNNAIVSGADKIIGEIGITSFAYYGIIGDKNIHYLILFLLLFSTILNNSNTTIKDFNIKEKIYILILLISIICMIWGSMYLLFTPVSSTIINGVQNRYFIPLIFPLLLILNSDKIKTNFKDLNIYYFYSFSILIINFYSIINTIVK